MSTSVRPDIRLLDPGFWVDLEGMHDAFRWARTHEPLFTDDESGFVAVTRHADVIDVERRAADFCSSRGYRSWCAPDETNMIAQDDPAHLAQRRLVSGEFTPRAVHQHDELLERLVDDCVGQVEAAAAGDGSVEIVASVAAQLPSRLTAVLLGFPEDRWREVQSWSERLMRYDSVPVDPDAAMGMFAACAEFDALLGEVADQRRACPASDLVSTWVTSGMDRLTLFHETGLFISGGAETTRTVIARGLRVLCDHPEQWEAMAADPSLLPGAVEELIRWVTPLNNMFRTATRDTEIAGTPIAEGTRLALVYPSANRDEAVFPEPFRFDIRRSPNPHVAFGQGTHFCLGANLARLELRLLFERLTQRITGLHVVEEPDLERNLFACAVRSFRLGCTPR